jgi:hypothetical protein
MFTANVPQKYVAGNGWKFEPPGRKKTQKVNLNKEREGKFLPASMLPISLAAKAP